MRNNIIMSDLATPMLSKVIEEEDFDIVYKISINQAVVTVLTTINKNLITYIKSVIFSYAEQQSTKSLIW